MDFYARNNLLKSEFKSFLLEWSGATNWKIKGLGYPYLNYNYTNNKLILEVFDSKSNKSLIKLDTQHFDTEMVSAKNAVILSYKEKLIEFCIVFQDKETSTRLYSIFKEHIVLSIIIRKPCGST